MKLWHVSEDAGLTRFEPRTPPSTDAGISHPVVWAVDDTRLVNYLLPRDCPRVVVRRGPATQLSDVARYLGPDPARVVVFIETPWLARSRDTTLWLYELPPESFRRIDANAGYWVSAQSVTPSSRQCVAAPLDALQRRGAELRVVPQLRPLAEAVAASSLAFSIIRLRNAAPRAPTLPHTPSTRPASPTIADR